MYKRRVYFIQVYLFLLSKIIVCDNKNVLKYYFYTYIISNRY